MRVQRTQSLQQQLLLRYLQLPQLLLLQLLQVVWCQPSVCLAQQVQVLVVHLASPSAVNAASPQVDQPLPKWQCLLEGLLALVASSSVLVAT